MNAIERKARELLAAEYEKEGWVSEANNCRQGISDAVDRFAISAISAGIARAEGWLTTPEDATLNMLSWGPQFGLSIKQTEDLYQRMMASRPEAP